MKIHEEYKLAKYLDDRLYNIENSKGASSFESPINVIQSRLMSDTEELGLEYLLNYQTMRLGTAINVGVYASNFFSIINQTEKFKESKKNAISLTPSDSKSELSAAMEKRRSIRSYKDTMLDKEMLANILVNTYKTKTSNDLILRNTPSGGGLYPIDLYVFVNKIKEVERGLYLYNPINESLTLERKGGREIVETILSNQEGISVLNASFVIFFSYDYLKNYQKYGDLAVSLGFIETGIVAQSIHILSTFYGLGTCDVGGFDKPLADDFLTIDGINQHCIYIIIAGEDKSNDSI